MYIFTDIYRDFPDSQPSDSTQAIQLQTKLNIGTPLHEKSLDASLKNSRQYYNHFEHASGRKTSLLLEDHGPSNLNIRLSLRRFLLPTIIVFVALSGLLAWSCVSNMPAWGVDLTRRAFEKREVGILSQF